MTEQVTKRLLAVVALGAAACAQELPPAPTLPQAKESPVEEISGTAEENALGGYHYDPTGKRDPFRNVLNIAAQTVVVEVDVEKEKKTPLQKWEIDQLRLVLTETGSASPKALIEDPTGDGHYVTLGTRVGKRYGKVTRILRDEVIITETIKDNTTGKIFPYAIPLRIKDSAEEAKAKQKIREGQIESGE